MPIYEYRCRSCGNRFEKIVRSASARPSCRSCGGRKVERVPSAFGIGGGGKTPSRAESGGGCGGCRSRSCAGCR